MPETNFFWEPVSDNILQERDETGTVTAEYTSEPGLFGNLLSQNREGVESQHHFDAQGSTLALTDDNQQVTDTFAYTAFGEVTEDTGSTANPFQYIGQKGYYKDEVTGEYAVSARTLLSPVEGRWLSVSIVDFPNPYVNAGNVPSRDSAKHDLSNADVSGLPLNPHIWASMLFADDPPKGAFQLDVSALLWNLAGPPVPCGAIELTKGEHTILLPVRVPNTGCPPGNLLKSGIRRLKIDKAIDDFGRKSTTCPPGCPKCVVIVRKNIPLSVPIAVVRRFCWENIKLGLFLIPQEVPCSKPGRKGPCWIVALIVIRVNADVEIGICQ